MVTFRNRYIFLSIRCHYKKFQSFIVSPYQEECELLRQTNSNLEDMVRVLRQRSDKEQTEREREEQVCDRHSCICACVDFAVVVYHHHHPHPFILFHTPKGGQGCLMPLTLSGISELSCDSSFPSLLSSST